MIPSRSGTVLFVDDEPAVVEALRRSHRRQAYQILVATSAEEGLATLAREGADMVVSDHRMPGMTGVEFLAAAARRFPDVMRVLLTGHATLPVALQAVNEGHVYRILLKPCSREDLTRTIEEALAQGRILAATSSLLDAGGRAGGSRKAGAPTPQSEARAPAVACPADGAVSPELFSRREQEVLYLLARGQRVAQIALALFVSQHTVRNHVKSMFRKAGVHSQSELVAMLERSE